MSRDYEPPPRYFKFTENGGTANNRTFMLDLEQIAVVEISDYEKPRIITQKGIYHCSREVAEKVMELLEKRG